MRNVWKAVRHRGSSIRNFCLGMFYPDSHSCEWLLPLHLILVLIALPLAEEALVLCSTCSVLWIYPQTYFIRRHLIIPQKIKHGNKNKLLHREQGLQNVKWWFYSSPSTTWLTFGLNEPQKVFQSVQLSYITNERWMNWQEDSSKIIK